MKDLRSKDFNKENPFGTATYGSTSNSAQSPMGELGQREASGPFTPVLNSLLSESFGVSLAGITLSVGEDEKNRMIRANGHTEDRHISLGSHIKQDPSDSLSMEVIAHETAHALAGRDQARSLLNEPGDRGEAKAYEAGRLFRHYTDNEFVGKPPQLSPASGGTAFIHRHEIEGPFGIHDPAHETMTAEALRRSGLIGSNDKFSSPAAWEYIRGVMWNDDPQCQFFNSNAQPSFISSLSASALGSARSAAANGRPGDWSLGKEWYDDFKKYEKQAANNTQFGVGSPLLARTHFGDMSPLHGMASKDGDKRESTLSTMMMWAEFTSKVGMGQIPGDAKLSDIHIPGFEMFSKDKTLEGKTVADLLGCDKTGGNVKQRAMGSLMHMVQDSYAGGHTEREDLGNGRKGNIINFHAYAHQDHDKHAEKDGFKGGYHPKESPEQQIARLDGGIDAVEQCTQLLLLMNKKNANWDEIKQHLTQHAFALTPQKEEEGAGPGKNFEQGPKQLQKMPRGVLIKALQNS